MNLKDDMFQNHDRLKERAGSTKNLKQSTS